MLSPVNLGLSNLSCSLFGYRFSISPFHPNRSATGRYLAAVPFRFSREAARDADGRSPAHWIGKCPQTCLASPDPIGSDRDSPRRPSERCLQRDRMFDGMALTSLASLSVDVSQNRTSYYYRPRRCNSSFSGFGVWDG